MTHELRVLLVEDSATDAELVIAFLNRGDVTLTSACVDTERGLRAALADETWDAVLCDHGMPGFSSHDALRIVRESKLTLPFVILSGTIGEEAAVEALKAGAGDVVLKTNLARLGPVLEREMRDAENRRHKDRLEATLHYEAFHDGLTGMPNRRMALEHAEEMLARARRSRQSVAALYVDLDGFKDVNDRFGHRAGDELLQIVAGRLASVTRETDLPARLAGDEFVVLTEGTAPESGPETLAARLLTVLGAPYELTGVPGRRTLVTASIGIAVGRRQTADELLHDADVALYAAKRSGRNQCAFFASAMRTEVRQVVGLRMDLADAIEQRQLFLHYQPIFDLGSETATGVEALVRWRRKRRTIEPADFIPVAETSGLIVPIGRWVLTEACRQAAVWHAAGHRITMAVNVSARQLDRDDLIEDVQRALHTSALPPTHLVLELTETALMRDPDATVERLHALKALGVGIMIDDFGTGYSSLAYLSRFPLDGLKIDRSFVNGMGSESTPESLVAMLVQLGRTLEVKTLAEGIEQTAQLRALQSRECDQGQGFLLGRPMTADGIERLLRPAP